MTKSLAIGVLSRGGEIPRRSRGISERKNVEHTLKLLGTDTIGEGNLDSGASDQLDVRQANTSALKTKGKGTEVGIIRLGNVTVAPACASTSLPEDVRVELTALIIQTHHVLELHTVTSGDTLRGPDRAGRRVVVVDAKAHIDARGTQLHLPSKAVIRARGTLARTVTNEEGARRALQEETFHRRVFVHDLLGIRPREKNHLTGGGTNHSILDDIVVRGGRGKQLNKLIRVVADARANTIGRGTHGARAGVINGASLAIRTRAAIGVRSTVGSSDTALVVAGSTGIPRDTRRNSRGRRSSRSSLCARRSRRGGRASSRTGGG